jgi:hypothetical protein
LTGNQYILQALSGSLLVISYGTKLFWSNFYNCMSIFTKYMKAGLSKESNRMSIFMSPALASTSSIYSIVALWDVLLIEVSFEKHQWNHHQSCSWIPQHSSLFCADLVSFYSLNYCHSISLLLHCRHIFCNFPVLFSC